MLYKVEPEPPELSDASAIPHPLYPLLDGGYSTAYIEEQQATDDARHYIAAREERES